ncbi:PucR family transcriptional regulator [Nocardia brasiliensis]|uniref:PucR family transcriptional regulator n=1 Tax=Nocardia brasiliensis TaxID=37326 RepID=UPI002454A0DB|nr:helix-turn-helix domain-containing protein [Nocardia brasiliensis]
MFTGTATVDSLVSSLAMEPLTVVAGARFAERQVSTIEFYDPVRGLPRDGAFILVAADLGANCLHDVVYDAARHDAAAVAVKGEIPPLPASLPLTIVRVRSDVSWMDLASALREQLLEHVQRQWSPAEADADLFAVADTISAAVHAPVTIEDWRSNVLAWSAQQTTADPMRTESIFARTVPGKHLRALERHGIFERLRTSPDPVFVPQGVAGDGAAARMALAVRGGGSVLGYVWLVVPEPLSARLSQRLTAAGELVAAHLLAAGHDTCGRAQRRRRELAEALIAGGPTRIATAEKLGLSDGPVSVLALGFARSATARRTTPSAGVSAETAELRRIEDSLAHYLAAVHTSGVAIRSAHTVYGILAWPHRTRKQACAAAQSLAADFAGRTPLPVSCRIAVSPPAQSVSDLSQARIQAEEILRTMCHPAVASDAVANLDGTLLSLALLQLADYADSIALPEFVGALRVLADQDGEQGPLLATLRAYLDSAGRAEVAAETLGLHVNTVRYRMRRIREVCGLDPEDNDAMLLAQLQLRVRELRRRNHPAPH